MFDSYNRQINYLRVSVTDLCNLRCRYCMPDTGVKKLAHSDILTLEEITEICRISIELGVDKIRLTGGEPLLRKGIVDLVAMIRLLSPDIDLCMTTNGTLLAEYAQHLKAAGLNRVNISLDTIDPQKFSQISRSESLNEIFAGIEAAQRIGLNPVKLNCVIENSIEEADAKGVQRFAKKNKLELRFIRQMNTAKGEYWPVIGGNGGNCQICNRIRVNSRGHVLSCLFSDTYYEIRKLGIKDAIHKAIENKPEKGHKSQHLFYQIGG